MDGIEVGDGQRAYDEQRSELYENI